MAKVNIKIEGIPYEVESGLTILEAAKAVAMRSPLCVLLITVSALRAPAVSAW